MKGGWEKNENGEISEQRLESEVMWREPGVILHFSSKKKNPQESLTTGLPVGQDC